MNKPASRSRIVKAMLVLALLGSVIVAGCEANSPGEKLSGKSVDPRIDFIAKDVQEAALTEGLTKSQESILSSYIIEGTIDKIDPTWIDKSNQDDKKIITDVTINVTNVYKGDKSKLKGQFLVARNKQRHDSSKNVELFNLRFDNNVLFYLVKTKDEFATTTGSFSNYYVLGMYIVDQIGEASYDQAIAEIDRTSKLARPEKLSELKGVPINQSVINELVGS